MLHPLFLCLYFSFCLCLSFGQYRNGGTVQTTSLEGHDTVGQGIQGIVLTHTYVLAGIVTCTTLANDYVTGDALLSTKNLNT